MNDNIKTYDIVILTYRPKDLIFKSLSIIKKQTIKPQKVIIANTEEAGFYENITDKKAFDELLNELKVELIHIKKEEFDHGKTRNYAASLGNSKFILFMTDDAVPYDENVCENLLSGFDEYSDKDSKVAVCYARQVPNSNASIKEKTIREFNYPDYDIIKEKSKHETLGIKNYFCSNVCAMYDREIFESLGKFEEDIILNEDTFYVYFAINKGYKIVYKSNAKVYHSHNLSYKEQFSRNFDIGVSQQQKQEIFNSIKSEKEGGKLLKYTIIKLLKGFHFIALIDFIIDCAFRYFGYKTGRKFNTLTIEKCIKYSNNKLYFIKRK